MDVQQVITTEVTSTASTEALSIPASQFIPCSSCRANGETLLSCQDCEGTGNELCELDQCKNPIPLVPPNSRRKLKHNIAAKRFCSAKCRSYKYWLDNKERLQARRKKATA